MSVRRNHGHQAGSIHRIALENFVTFRQVEIFPSSALNLIIGPNGTGKSTFVCAIVLGLGGKTNVIGRAKTIGEYVKSGHEQATIEIELYQNEGENNVIITRNFNKDNNSVWSIDNKPVKLKDIHDLTENLNIRVDNLCQLLPQDRVQDFAKMNPQELLKSTQIAVSGQEAVDMLSKLIEKKISHRSLTQQLNNLTQKLQELEALNANMHAVIDSMHVKKNMEKEIGICEKKRTWVEYDNLKCRVDDLNKDKDDATKLVKTHQERMLPLQQQIDNAKGDVSKLEDAKSNVVKEMSLLMRKIREMKDTSFMQNGNIRELESELSIKIMQQENKYRDIEQANAMLSRMQNDRNNLLQQYGDESMVREEMAKLHQPITKTNAGIEQLKQKKIQLQYELESKIIPHLRLCENRLRSLGDIANKRLEVLQSVNEQTYKAVMWLRENRELFQENVYEPIILELNFKEPYFAKYLENTVALRDLVAFTFESSSDMNLFLKKVRSEMGLNLVNAVCSPPTGAVYRPNIPIDQLRQFGFSTYLVDCIIAPDAIVRFLCKLYGIHRIPIGNDDTYRQSDNVPPQVNNFFSENHRFTIKVSEYSGAKSTSTNEIRPAKLMVNTLDQEVLSKVQNELDQVKQEQSGKRTSMKTIDDNLAKLEDSVNSLLSKRKLLHESLEQIKTISARIRMQQNKITTLENEGNIDIEAEKQRCRSEISKCVLEQCRIQLKINELIKSCQNKSLNGLILGEKLGKMRTDVVEQQRCLRVLKDNANSAEVTLENIIRQLTNTKNMAKEKLQEAKEGTGNLLPHENGFPFAKEFSQLPVDFNTLQDYINVLQSKISCMEGGDNQLIKEFEVREATIRKLKKEVASLNDQNRRQSEKMIELREKWLPALERDILKINQKFGEMFAQLGCAGEVQISKPGGDEEYDTFGISILVRFRSEEQLQVLSSHLQSGGERALSTALYLMALQQLSKVPFRCVDEVNQGMDPINERKMIQLLVNITSTTDNSQYFLLTPKLLRNLEYTSSVAVHVIQNGPRIMKYNKWSFNEFIKKAKILYIDIDSD